MTNKSFCLRPLVIAAAYVLAGGLTTAQAQQAGVKKVGPFTIEQINADGSFHRCAATLQGDGANGGLRISYTKTGIYSISVPGIPSSKQKTMFFLFGDKPIEVPAETDPKRIRAWAEASPAMMDQLKKVRGKIAIDYDVAKYRWPIGSTNMGAVVSAVEACTLAAVKGAGGAAKAPAAPAKTPAIPPKAAPAADGAPRVVYPDFAGASQTCVVAVDPQTRQEKVAVGSELALAAGSNRCKAFVVNAGRITLAGQPKLCVNIGAGAHNGVLYVENCQDTSVRWEAKGSAVAASRIRSQGDPFDNMCWTIPKLPDAKAKFPLQVLPAPCQRDAGRELKFFID